MPICRAGHRDVRASRQRVHLAFAADTADEFQTYEEFPPSHKRRLIVVSPLTSEPAAGFRQQARRRRAAEDALR